MILQKEIHRLKDEVLDISKNMARRHAKVKRLEDAIDKQLKTHRNFPPQGSARWQDMQKSRLKKGVQLRECDCDVCMAGRAALAYVPKDEDVL